MNVELIDYLSMSGTQDRTNEDTFAFEKGNAIVVDGATGLGEEKVFDSFGSDAAWLADFAANYLMQNTVPDSELHSVVLECINSAKFEFNQASRGKVVERYAWPSASFVFVRCRRHKLEFYGLGDCVAYFGGDERVDSFSPLEKFSSFEISWATRHIEKTGGFGSNSDLLSNPETLKDLRAMRSLQNTSQSGVWTLGLEPEASQYVVTKTINNSGISYCLLCSDGFSALVDSYGAFTPDELLNEARTSGLDFLYKELRNIEKVVDPDGKIFPRFKRSDDATAILLKIL